MAVRNARALFNEIPKGYPDPNKTIVYDDSETIDLENTPLNGGVLLKTLIVSVDPYLRGRMREEETSSYRAAFKLGEPIANYGISRILRSENKGFKEGEYVFGVIPFAEYNVLTDVQGITKIPKDPQVPWSAYLGVCGMPGKTAYYGWTEYAKPKKGETIFVTTGAGPVGSLVIQLAKADGLKVIASAGSDDKVLYMKEIGADVAFNYKKESTKEVLEKHGPINIYWDHVGGETLDIALEAAAPFARFLEVGMISQYNTAPVPLKNIMNVLGKSITMQGFIVGNLDSKYAEEFYRVIPPKVARGEILYKEYLNNGFQETGRVLLEVLTGKNFGKSIIIVADDN